MFAQQMEVNNTTPRLDNEGNIVDAHDGRMAKFGDRYYWYGTSYGNTNGFTTANNYVCYSSTDLKNWKKEGRLLPNQPEGVYYRPHVIYNKKTKNYVLWYNWYPKLWDGKFGVATSKNPEGPFKIKNSDVKMFRSDVGLGDFGLFIDDDETAYISYNTIQNHQVSIEKLQDDYLSSTMENGGIIAEHMEAGSQFKRNGKYYLLTDYTCCFCNYGSGARVYISDKPMTDFVFTGNINRYAGQKSLVLNDGISTGTEYVTLAKKEENYNFLQTEIAEPSVISQVEIHLFTGNRPENCGDVANPRVHPEIKTPEFELYYWDYKAWVKISNSSVKVQKSALKEVVTLNFEGVQLTKLKIDVKSTCQIPLEEIYINEIKLNDSDTKTITQLDWFIGGKSIPQNPIIPAQQTFVMKLNSEQGDAFIWMGDLWGSASDNIKGHDYQYWSKPLEFNEDGTIRSLKWSDSWNF
tara:strand:- start:70144 stop:71535 length:1392 start_codon:yes stop_codon:yes gene_type:complete